MDLLHYDEEKPQTRTAYFWWSVFILLLTGACFASWIGCFYVVSHPENPRCYRFLKKLKRLDPPKRFEVTQVPHGDFLTVSKLLERFGKIGPEELAQENARLLRGYLMNFREAKKRMVNVGGKMVAQQDVVYVVGRFDVVASHVLGPADLFPNGVVALAQSLEAPQVLIEAVFTTPGKTARAMQAALPTGGNLQLERSLDLFAVVHVERAADGHLQFTAIPLPYNAWQTKRGDAFFRLKSPEELEKDDAKDTLNVAAGLPVVRGERLQRDLAAYVEHRRKLLADGAVEEETWAPTLVRFDPSRDDTEGAVTPRVVRPPEQRSANPGAAAPAHSSATPAPANAVRPAVIAPAPATTEIRAAAPLPTAQAPAATPAPAPPAIVPKTLTPVPPPVPATVPPTPSKPAAPAQPQVPRRIVSIKEAAEYANHPATIPPSVLGGDFLVSGLDGRRAQLRAPVEPDWAAGKPPIVLVDFPTGTTLPSPGSGLRRQGPRGFVIKNVGRNTNGQVVIQAIEQVQ